MSLVRSLLALAALIVVLGPTPTAYCEINDTTRAQFTVDRMLDISLAWEAYASDTNSYLPALVRPRVAPRSPADGTSLVWQTYMELTYAELRAALVPTYIRQLPPVDGWDSSFQFAVVLRDGQGVDYLIRSLGSDRAE